MDSFFCLLQVIAGWYAADALSGAFHYCMDNYGSEKTLLLGGQIREFRRHHEEPLAFFKDYSLGDNLWKPLLASLVFLPLCYFFPFFGVPLAFGIAIVQIAHRWAHEDNPWAIARLGQRLRLLISQRLHQRHHDDATVSYCVINGWANPLVDAVAALGKPRS